MRSWALVTCLALAAATLPSAAHAQGGTAQPAAAIPTDEQRKAQEHFQRAKELYGSGKYGEAIAELEVARRLDPKARDLVMNLGIVYEKLGKYDEAIQELRAFLDMDGVTPPERAKAEGMIRRIEGAKRAAPTPAPTEPKSTQPPTEKKEEPKEPANGRIDALTIGAASLSVVGLALGTGLGIYALSARPSEGFVTGRDGTYAQLEEQANNAHTVAIVADVSLIVGALAGGAAAWLYFGRPAVPAASGEAAKVSVRPSVSAAGGGLLLRGAF